MHAVWATGGDVESDPLVAGGSRAAYNILYRRRDAQSGAWGKPLTLARGQHPQIAIGGNGAPVFVWEQGGVVSIARWTGGSGIAVQRLATSASFPSLTRAPSGNFLIAWQEPAAGNKQQIRAAQLRIRP